MTYRKDTAQHSEHDYDTSDGSDGSDGTLRNLVGAKPPPRPQAYLEDKEG